MRIASLFFPFCPAVMLALLPGLSSGQTTAGEANTLPFTLKPIGEGIYAAIDDAKGDAGANAGFVIGGEGVLVVDTFDNEAAAKQLLTEIRKLTKLPVKFAVNTHYHIDHVAGNAVFKEAGAAVLAQRNVSDWMHTENLKFFGKNIKPEQKAMVQHLAAPDILFDSDLQVALGSREVLVHAFPGHTGGDAVVMIPDAKVVFCGDLFWRKTLPNLIDASTEPWMETLEDLETPTPSPAVKYVPGHGEVGDFHDVEAFRGYLADLRELTGKEIKGGKSGEDLVNAVLPAIKEKYGTWGFFEHFAKKNINDTAAELRGVKRIPEPALAP